jgi:hypothetical protein
MTKPLTSNGARAVPFYYPFEAAIAWCELSEDEARTVRLDMQVAPGPMPPDYPEWPCLYERAALIVHALKTGELPYGLHGKPGYDRLPLESELPWLTVHWRDLKDWIADNFPSEKPAFLFSATERAAQADLDRAAELAEENAALREENDLLRAAIRLLDIEASSDLREDIPIEPLELESLGLDYKLTNRLADNRIYTIDTLAKMTKFDLLHLYQVGPKSVKEIEKALDKKGLSLSG